jgi:hypothetical protein
MIMTRSAWLLMAGLLAPAGVQAAENFCDQSESRITTSPDRRWVVKVQEEVCATENGAAAGITVILAAADDAARNRRVFIMPVPRSRDDWPRIRWPAADAMEIRVPNLTEALPPEPEYSGVRLSLVYCGDNPQDRERQAAYKAAVKQWQKDVTAWAARRKQDAEAAGARPPRPEEPRLAPGRCID